jgi:hypothetical protein
MTFKEILIQELDNVPDSLIAELIDFLQFLKAKQEQDQEDVQDAIAALSASDTEGTISWEQLKVEIGL